MTSFLEHNSTNINVSNSFDGLCDDFCGILQNSILFDKITDIAIKILINKKAKVDVRESLCI